MLVRYTTLACTRWAGKESNLLLKGKSQLRSLYATDPSRQTGLCSRNSCL